MSIFKKIFGGAEPAQRQQNGPPPGDLDGLFAYYNNLIMTEDYDNLIAQLDDMFFHSFPDKLADLITDHVSMKLDHEPRLAAQPMASVALSANLYQGAILQGAHFYTRLGTAHFSKRPNEKISAISHKKAIKLVERVPGYEDGVGSHVLVIAYVGLSWVTNDTQSKCKLLKKAVSLSHNNHPIAIKMHAVAVSQLQELC